MGEKQSAFFLSPDCSAIPLNEAWRLFLQFVSFLGGCFPFTHFFIIHAEDSVRQPGPCLLCFGAKEIYLCFFIVEAYMSTNFSFLFHSCRTLPFLIYMDLLYMYQTVPSPPYSHALFVWVCMYSFSDRQPASQLTKEKRNRGREVKKK